MIFFAVVENDKPPKNWSTVENLSELYRGLANGITLDKFISLSNFTLYASFFDFDEEFFLNDEQTEARLYHPMVENLADTLYEYMYDNLDVYYDLVKQIDGYRTKVQNYKVDKQSSV